MKKLFFNFNRLLLLSLAVMIVGNVWGAETLVYTNNCPKSTTNSAYATNYDVTISSLGWNAPGNQYATGAWRVGGKNLSNAHRYIYTTNTNGDIKDKNISKVTIQHGAASSVTLGDFTFDVYSTAAKAATGGTGDVAHFVVSSSTGIASKTTTFTRTSGSWKNCYYRFEYIMTIGNSNKYILLNNIKFYYDPDEGSCTSITPTLSYSSTATVGDVINPTLDKDGSSGTATYSIKSGDSYATIDSNTGELTCTGAGTVVVKVDIAAAGDKCEGSAESGNIVISAPSYTVTASSNNTDLGTVSISNNIITASPKSCVGYESPAYTVTSGTATVSKNGNEFTVTPTANCNVQINFAALSSDTYVDNVHSTSMTGNYCGSYTAPKIDDKTEVKPAAQTGDCANDHYHFVGWSSSKISIGQSTEPSGLVKEGAAMTANGTTYYAVWAKEAQ